MLVLTRKTNETIHIGENITITIVRVKGRAVGVGIEAPKDVRVARGEISDRPERSRVEDAALNDQPRSERPRDQAPRADAPPAEPGLAESLRQALEAERKLRPGEPSGTLHEVIHRRVRRPAPPSSPENRMPRPASRLTLRDFLPSR